MKTNSIGCALLCIALTGILPGCGQRKKTDASAANKDSGLQAERRVTDTSRTAATRTIIAAEKIYTAERGRFSNGAYVAYINAHYLLPEKLTEDSSFYFDDCYFYLINKKTNQKDSIKLPEDPRQIVSIDDVSHLISGKAPLFRASWSGDSDVDIDQFFGFRDDRLQMLFEFENLLELNRKDDSTLTGIAVGRDELLYQFEQYPVRVLLPDFAMEDQMPLNQAIGYPTKVLFNFTGYKISGKGASAYSIRAGSEIFVDSINRDKKMVRIRTKDSVVLYVPFDKIKGKVQTNAAG